MLRAYKQDQDFLLPPSLSDFIGQSHPAHMVNDIVEKLDLRELEGRYGTMGQPAYAPRMMLKVILYGFTVGIFSSRKLQRACEENLAFKFLAGMETPAFKTFIEFRRRHREDMKAVFVATVKLAREMGLAKLGGVALDGTKMEANTSKHKAMSYGRMLEEEKGLKAEIETMLKAAEEADAREDEEEGPGSDGYNLSEELALKEKRLAKIEAAKAALEERENKEHPEARMDNKKISFADKDARCFSRKLEGTEYVYNSQAAVDMESQVIVGNHIEESVTDFKAAEPALKAMEENLGRCPEKLVTDAGYGNQHTLESCEKREVVPVCAISREGKTPPPMPLDDWSYERGSDQLICPHGEVFEFARFHPKSEKRIYRSRAALGCVCSRWIDKEGRRLVSIKQWFWARRELRRIMGETGHEELYRRRKCTVEPVFGQIREAMGFRRYFYRGRENVRGEWNLVCAAFNVRKITGWMMKGVEIARRSGSGGPGVRLLPGIGRYIHLSDYLVAARNALLAPSLACA
jgi:transposase